MKRCRLIAPGAWIVAALHLCFGGISRKFGTGSSTSFLGIPFGLPPGAPTQVSRIDLSKTPKDGQGSTGPFLPGSERSRLNAFFGLLLGGAPLCGTLDNHKDRVTQRRSACRRITRLMTPVRQISHTIEGLRSSAIRWLALASGQYPPNVNAPTSEVEVHSARISKSPSWPEAGNERETVSQSQGPSDAASNSHEGKDDSANARNLSRIRVQEASGDFGATFDVLDYRGIGNIGLIEIQRGISVINKRHDMGLCDDDSRRLLEFIHGPLKGATAHRCRVTRAAFVREVGRLCGIIKSFRGHLSLSQLKVVVTAAFERFDINMDGKMSAEEFASAAVVLGLELRYEDATYLHRFFAPNEGRTIEQASLTDGRPVWEKCGDALKRCLERMHRRSGWRSTEHIVGRLREAMDEPGSVQDKVGRARDVAWNAAEEVADAANLAVDVAGMALSVQYVAEGLQQSGQELDAGELAVWSPFLALIGLVVVNFAKEVDEFVLKEMTEDEALLFARVFHPAGFSQAEFRRLLGLRGCRWQTAARGDVLSDPADASLKVVVRGSVEVRRSPCLSAAAGGSVQLPEGTAINASIFLRGNSLWDQEALVANEDVLYIAWDPAPLHQCLEHHVEMGLRMEAILVTSISSGLRLIGSFRRLCGGAVEPLPPSAEKISPIPSIRSNSVYLPRTSAPCLPASSSFIPSTARGISKTAPQMRKGSPSAIRQAAVGPAFGGPRDDAAALRGRQVAPRRLLGRRRAPRRDAASEEARGVFELPDLDTDGFVDRGVSETTVPGCSLEWLDALQVAAACQAERSGLTRFCYLTDRLRDVCTGTGDPCAKACLVLAMMWDGFDGVADVGEAAKSAAGVCAASYGIWQKVFGDAAQGLDDLGCSLDDDLNLAPCLIFLGLLGVKAMRHMADGDISDLSGPDALLYSTAFERHGFTISEFQRLVRCAFWVEVGVGERLMFSSSQDFFAVVSHGVCEISYGAQAAKAAESSSSSTTKSAEARTVVLGPGDLIGEVSLLPGCTSEGESVTVSARAHQATLVAWDVNRLRRELARNERLQMKVHRVVTLSAVDQQLGSHGRRQ